MAARYGSSMFSGPRLIGLIVVIAIHIGFVWMLRSGLAHSVVEVLKGPVEAEMIEEEKVEEDIPPPPPPEIAPPPPFVPPPVINIQAPPSPRAITQVTDKPTPPAPPKPDSNPVPTRATQPPYPASAQRQDQQGEVILQAYVDESGRVVEVKLVTSSGVPVLDEAALEHVKKNWRYKPATKGGKPIGFWQDIRIIFDLKKAR
jgi:protein TonB